MYFLSGLLHYILAQEGVSEPSSSCVNNFFYFSFLTASKLSKNEKVDGLLYDKFTPAEVDYIVGLLSDYGLTLETALKVFPSCASNAINTDEEVEAYKRALQYARMVSARNEATVTLEDMFGILIENPPASFKLLTGKTVKAEEVSFDVPEDDEEETGDSAEDNNEDNGEDPTAIARAFFEKFARTHDFPPDEDEEDEDDILSNLFDLHPDEEDEEDKNAEGLDRLFAESGEKEKKEKSSNGLSKLLTSVEKVKSTQTELLDKVYGQDLAVSTFVSGYFQAELVALAHENRKRPLATFLFAGPPGVGKTFLAEQAAEVLKLPYKRFDMSEYCEKESNLQFCGSDKVYKNGSAGIVTSFVAENPKSILLFDEVEKAHLNVIHLFLQILDAGRIRDNFTAEEVSFTDTILIFTTNAGKQLYDDPSISNLSGLSRKTILKALSTDMNPVTGTPLFPAAICSRFASGNVVMFNRLDAHNLLQVIDKEFSVHASSFEKNTGITTQISKAVPYALIYSEGGKADARSIRGKTVNFFYQELYELFRLTASDKNPYSTDGINKITFGVTLPQDEKIRALFDESFGAEVLIFAADEVRAKCEEKIKSVGVRYADSLDKAKEELAKGDISVIFIDIACHATADRATVLNLEDLDSAGRDFFGYCNKSVNIPIYILQGEAEISKEESMSFARDGARGIVEISDENLDSAVVERCGVAAQQQRLLQLAKSNKVLSFETKQNISADGKEARIDLFDFKLSTAVDAEDNQSVLSDLSRPDLRFDDVIGAKDAKEELSYFVEYLKNPSKFVHMGVKPPRGILLYGPPGTGKTMLAKAMAGESEVTFIASEGNSFLKGVVGEGSAEVHRLFATARKYAPSILFIDEIDAIARPRGNGASTDDVLTAFLTEMDGFSSNGDKPVFVLSATNYDIEQGTARSLDSALLRRFDRKIFIDLPNKAERETYIKLKTENNKNFKITPAQIDNIAVRSTGMSLADLELVIEFALRNAIKSQDCLVDDGDFEEAFEQYNSGEVKKWDEATLTRTARHEAGHAVLCWLGGETPSYLTIVARGNHGGYMQHGGSEGKALYTRAELLARIRTALGGRASEIVYYGEEDGLSTGASGDLTTATAIAEQMVCTYGMDCVFGVLSLDLNSVANTPYFSQTLERVDAILQSQLEEAVKLIQKNRRAVDALVEALLTKNHLKGDEIDEILKANADK